MQHIQDHCYKNNHCRSCIKSGGYFIETTNTCRVSRDHPEDLYKYISHHQKPIICKSVNIHNTTKVECNPK